MFINRTQISLIEEIFIRKKCPSFIILIYSYHFNLPMQFFFFLCSSISWKMQQFSQNNFRQYNRKFNKLQQFMGYVKTFVTINRYKRIRKKIVKIVVLTHVTKDDFTFLILWIICLFNLSQEFYLFYLLVSLYIIEFQSFEKVWKNSALRCF